LVVVLLVVVTFAGAAGLPGEVRGDGNESAGAGSAALTAGNTHSCGLYPDGTARCWGGNNVGQLGNGDFFATRSAVAVSGITDAVAIGAGSYHTCAVLGDGTVRCWGGNEFGQIGNGTSAPQVVRTPATVVGLAGAVAVSAGFTHSCAVLGDGTVRCWGLNDLGQLGVGVITSSLIPVAVAGIGAAVAVSAGGGHTCALLSDGTVRCWGWNQYGQLGVGTVAGSPTPVTVGGLTGVVALSAGGLHTCALLSDGTVRCWGWNQYGQLGDGTVAGSVTPVSVVGLAGAVAVSAGDFHTCASLADGTARCWGLSGAGALGDGTTTDSSTPVVVSGLDTAVAVTAGRDHSCALLSDGTARCWGWGSAGLGIWDTGDQRTPAPVVGFGPCAAVADVGMVGAWAGEAPANEGLNGAVATGPGRVGSALQFDGSNVVTAPGVTPVSDAVSVEMWVKPRPSSMTQALVSRWDFPSTDDSARSFNLLLSPDSGGRLLFETDETSTRRPEGLSAVVPAIFDGQFHHVAVTWDRFTAVMYFDGVEVAWRRSQGGVLNAAPTVPVRLGGQTGAPFAYTGSIDEPSIWSRVLTPAEVANIGQLGAKCPLG
jgi:alpha-tubulin suppressor-like RCC1 family protein